MERKKGKKRVIMDEKVKGRLIIERDKKKGWGEILREEKVEGVTERGSTGDGGSETLGE